MSGLKPILIVGGGIAALSLAGRSAAAVLPRKSRTRSAWQTTGAAITMHANRVRPLRMLGLGTVIDRFCGAAAVELP